MATGGNSDNTRIEWIATIGGMIKHRAVVRALCDRCGADDLVNLKRLERALGSGGTLLNRHPPCKTPGCDGRILFHASPGPSTPSRPCVTVAGVTARWRRERDERDRIKALRNG